MYFKDNTKIGFFLIMISVVLYGMGVIFLFDRGLILFSNITFVGGIYSLRGFMGTAKFFAKPQRICGSAVLLGGFVLIYLRLTFVGVLLQGYGLFIVFKKFIPYMFEYVLSFPSIGPFLKHNKVFNWLFNKTKKSQRVFV